MKKRGILLLAVSIGLMLTACTDSPKTTDIPSGSAAGDTVQNEIFPQTALIR